MKDIRHNRKGFSLIELLVVLVISGVVLSGIYSVYSTNQKVFTAQQQTVEMEQNLRAATFMLVSDLKMAGYDPTRATNAGIVAPLSATTITITMDSNSDGVLTADENITYSLADPDGVGRPSLCRYSTAPPDGEDVIAENIDDLNFVYLDGDGAVATTSDDVRSIQVSIIARTTHRTADGFVNNTAYMNLQNATIYPAQNDAFRRRQLNSWIKCRNLGL